MALVYAHKRLDTNEVFYIGIELDTNIKIAKGKRSKIKDRNPFWTNIVNKTNYSIEIIIDNIDNNQAKEYEIFLIKLYGRRDLNKGSLVNLTNGGDGAPGKITPQHVKDKISKTLKGKNKGSLNGNYGKVLTPEQKSKLIKYGKDNWMYNNPIFRGANSPCAKKIINTKTLKMYNCLEECANDINMKKTTLAAQLNGQNKNKTDLLYYENYLKLFIN